MVLARGYELLSWCALLHCVSRAPIVCEAEEPHAHRFAYTGGKTNQDAFFTSQAARAAYKAHVRTVITRRNTINGKVGMSAPGLRKLQHVWREALHSTAVRLLA